MTWTLVNLSKEGKNVPVGAWDAPVAITAYVWETDQTEHVVYRSYDNHLHELWYNNEWHHRPLTKEMNAPLSDSAPIGYACEAEGSEHVIYRSQDRHIHRLSYGHWGGDWRHIDLTDATKSFAIAIGTPTGYAWNADGTEHIVYRDLALGDKVAGLTELHHHKGRPEDEWHRVYVCDTAAQEAYLAPITIYASGDPNDATGDPHGYAWETDGTEHIIYCRDREIYELWYDYKWHHRPLSKQVKAPPTGFNAHLACFTWETNNSEHIIYRDVYDKIQELRYDKYGDGDWHATDLIDKTNAPYAGGDPVAYAFEMDKSEHVFYLGRDSHMHELYRHKEGAWQHTDLTTSEAKAPVASALTGFAWEQDKTIHLFYISGGDVIELWNR